jgi:hypothetical protein
MLQDIDIGYAIRPKQKCDSGIAIVSVWAFDLDKDNGLPGIGLEQGGYKVAQI